jgi:DNA-binding transcriptional LysR family regulator
MSDLDRFELFTYVAQANSLSSAAEKLGMSKPSLSKQIKQLEKELKVDLFSRSGYRLVLTPQGEALLKQSLRLKRELDDTRSICHQFHQEPEGELRVVVFGYFAHKLIFPRLKTFLEKYPKLRLTIDTSERVPSFDREEVDLAVGFSLPVPDSEEIMQCSMGTTYYTLCASPDYFSKFGEPKTLEDLKKHQIIRHASCTHGFLKLKPGLSLELAPHLLVNTVNSMIECAKQGLGIVQLPIYLTENAIKEGVLISVLSKHQRTDEPIYYHYPKYRHIQPKVRKFIDFFLV